jgi:Icc-related predicted phosphoesterase
MKIDCISDLHGHQPELEGGDLLIVAGDLTARDEFIGYVSFYSWLARQSYDQIIIVPGNHDGMMSNFKSETDTGTNLSILIDGAQVYNDLKIYGSPWTPTFFNWHFMKDRGEDIKKMWDLIPDDTDILVTHGPPFGVLDYAHGDSQGCEELLKAVWRVKPKLHVFGHIHEGYGQTEIDGTIFVNASIMDGRYRPRNKPVTVILEETQAPQEVGSD